MFLHTCAKEFMSLVPVFFLNFGLKPCALIAERNALTSGVFFPATTASSPSLYSILAFFLSFSNNSAISAHSVPGGRRIAQCATAVCGLCCALSSICLISSVGVLDR